MKSKAPSLPIRAHCDINGQRLFYDCIGSGPPLVLLHGFGVSGRMWQRSIPYLAQHAQVFIIDLPGHGRSKHKGPWRLREIAPLMAQWIAQMGLPKVTLIGHSMGGAIAVHLTAHAPALVERLILVNAAAIPLGTSIPALSIRSIRSIFQAGGGGYPLLLVADVIRPRPRVLWQAAREMVSSDFREELAAIQVPTLIIWGEHDLLLPFSLGLELHKALPHARFIGLPNCGHRPPLSQPALFSQLVLDFLQAR